MSVIQSEIPFKIRKRVVALKKDKSNNENEFKINSVAIQRKVLKRRNKMEDLSNENGDGKCSDRKVLRSTTSIVNVNTPKNGTSENKLTPLPSREKEIEFLEVFLMEQLEKEESASLYISGQPGTGKTACLTYVMQLPKIKEGYKQVFINCTMMKSARSIYNRICTELQLSTTSTTEKASLNAIEKYLSKKHKMTLLVLDEMDQLDSKHQAVLYSIFEWCGRADARLVVVGAANALDLTQRALPRLQARPALRPSTLHFPPYDKQQIIRIFTDKLAAEDNSKVFTPLALQMLAAKISAVSGDMRRALDIGRRVIELARRHKFSVNQSVETLMEDKTVTVEIKQVLEVLSDVYGGSKKIETEVEDGFPMQQKLILCSLMLMLTKGKNKDIVMGKLYDVYKRVAECRNIGALELSEVWGACSLLEARGAVRAGPAGGAGGAGVRSRRLRLLWDEAELAAALRDKPLLSSILDDVRCLPNHA